MEDKYTKDKYISLLAILLSNAVIVYGVLYLNWNFFMVIYSYWFGELISTLFDKIKYRTLVNRKELPKGQEEGRLFFLFIYWVFIIVIVGFVTAPEKTYMENILVILFLNKVFNLNLLMVFLGELGIYLHNFILFKNYKPENVIAKNNMMNKKTLIMHLSIIAGTFIWFSMHGDKFFFHIDAGKYGDYGFMMVFVVIRLAGDLIMLKKEFSAK